MKKVLLLQGSIAHYRVPIFNLLAQHVDLTVVYSSGKVPQGINFKTLYIPTLKLHFQVYKQNIYKLARDYDIVIATFDFWHIDFKLMERKNRPFKLIYWGIGVAASYNCRYDSIPKVGKKFFNAIKKADAALFYCDYPVEKYATMGINRDKMFVTNNTVQVQDITSLEQTKDSFLFIGSLYKQKKIDELLISYLRAVKKNDNLFKLIIIGEGEEYDNIQNWIKENGLIGKIDLLGGIYEEDVLAKYFARALICISPDQAGLSVLKSMGYGVPYITNQNAITGGEIFNIKNGENGILIKDFNELEQIMLDALVNKERYLEMGYRAQKYYEQNRRIDQMVEGFLSAIDYVSKE